MISLIPRDDEFTKLMPLNTNGYRLQSFRKLHNKPKALMKSRQSRSTYRNRAYKYNSLPSNITKITDKIRFKKEIKEYMFNAQ